MIALLLLVTIVFTLIYSLICRRLKWRDILVEGGFPVVPAKNLFSGNLDLTRSDRTPWKLKELREQYGKTYAIMQGAFPTVVTSDPDVIQDVCLKKFRFFHSRMADPTAANPDVARDVHVFAARGERWKRIRSLTSPALSNQNLKKLFPTILDSVSNFMSQLQKENISSSPVELHRRFQNLTFDVISRCCLGREESNQGRDPNLELLLEKFSPHQKCDRFSLTSFSWCLPEIITLLEFYNSLRSYLWSLLGKRPDPIAIFARNLCNIVDKKQKTFEKFDFLQFMKNVEDSGWEGWKTNNDVATDMGKVKITKKMLREEIVATCRFMSSAGFDTTANTLTYLTYMLAAHPDKQEKLWTEIEGVQEPSYDAILQLHYLHWAVAETLRLFPHASLLQSRLCVQNCEVGPYKFHRGTNIVFDTWSLHHDKDVWGEDADQFRPERFGEKRTLRQMQSWTPFGVGPRQCIGMRFALIEAKTAIFYLLKCFQIRKVNGQSKMCLRLREMGTVWPDSAKVIIEPRTNIEAAKTKADVP